MTHRHSYKQCRLLLQRKIKKIYLENKDKKKKYSREQIIAIAFSITKRNHPNCIKFIKRKK